MSNKLEATFNPLPLSYSWQMPVWMTEHILEALGGREYVEHYMGRRWLTEGFAAVQEHRDLLGKIEVLQRLHEKGDL